MNLTLQLVSCISALGKCKLSLRAHRGQTIALAIGLPTYRCIPVGELREQIKLKSAGLYTDGKFSCLFSISARPDNYSWSGYPGW